MSDNNPQDFIGTYFIDDGIVFRVESYAKGWFTSKSADGVEQKDRLKDLESYEKARTQDYNIPAEADDEDEDAPKYSQASQLKKYAAGYITSVAPSGAKSKHSGDSVAEAMEYMQLDDLYVEAGKILPNISEAELREKYQHLNKGSQRMNIGNRIRAQYKKETESVVAWVEDRLGDKE